MKLIIRKYNQEFFAVNASPTIVRLIVRVAEGGSSNSGVQSVTAGTNVTITGTATNPIINATGGGSSYLSYVALVSQSGTDAPTATVLQNTLGFTIAYSYVGVGSYNATSSVQNAFPPNKTVIFPGSGYGADDIFNAINFEEVTEDVIRLKTGQGSGETNDVLYLTAFEIRVYP